MTTYDWAKKKEPEKTWPVNIGAISRYKLLKIIEKIKDAKGVEVTQRSVVEKSIDDLYAAIVGNAETTNT